jgi:hypothetical protein
MTETLLTSIGSQIGSKMPVREPMLLSFHLLSYQGVQHPSKKFWDELASSPDVRHTGLIRAEQPLYNFSGDTL